MPHKPIFFALLLLAAASAGAATATAAEPPPCAHHEMITLEEYTIFDYVAWTQDGRDVVLVGEVTQPVLVVRATRLARRLMNRPVRSRIRVLSRSRDDDRIRREVARAIYGYAPLEQYALEAHPPIHILVNNGNVTLVGSVLNGGDRNVALLRAAAVRGVLSVTNALELE